jgi:hypothetical protein
MAMPVIAAEEAAGAASSVAAAHKAKKAAKSAKSTKSSSGGQRTPRNLNGLSAEEAREELQARKADAAGGKAESSAAPPPSSPGDGAITTPSGRSLPVMPAAASTGSGFLLGVFAWALGLAYLRGGGPEVRRLLAAKFFNKTEG